MKKVLIALDYDPTAQKVAETGYSLSRALGAETILLHVMSNPTYYVPRNYSTIMGFTGFVESDPIELENIAILKQRAQNFLDKSKHHLGDNNIRTLIGEGDFAEAILKIARDSHADVIVIGSHSRKWLENIVMGSVTESVLQNTSIPLLIVPTRKRYRVLHK